MHAVPMSPKQVSVISMSFVFCYLLRAVNSTLPLQTTPPFPRALILHFIFCVHLPWGRIRSTPSIQTYLWLNTFSF
jgi:hypothetical protein